MSQGPLHFHILHQCSALSLSHVCSGMNMVLQMHVLYRKLLNTSTCSVVSVVAYFIPSVGPHVIHCQLHKHIQWTCFSPSTILLVSILSGKQSFLGFFFNVLRVACLNVTPVVLTREQVFQCRCRNDWEPWILPHVYLHYNRYSTQFSALLEIQNFSTHGQFWTFAATTVQFLAFWVLFPPQNRAAYEVWSHLAGCSTLAAGLTAEKWTNALNTKDWLFCWWRV